MIASAPPRGHGESLRQTGLTCFPTTRHPNSLLSSTESPSNPCKIGWVIFQDLGEIMVIAHAVVAAEAGATVTVLIDDGQGARTATSEIGRLQRLRSSGHAVGSIKLASTLTVLARAAGSQHIPDRATMSHIYKRLRHLDDGLPPIEVTDLLASQLWS
jgi:hypothetical protein